MSHQVAGSGQDGTARWCRAFSLADFPHCKAIALEMLEDGSERQFALKSLAQALHYMGHHAQARHIAEEVRGEARDVLQSTVVPPFVSMSIVLARIAHLEGDDAAATAIAAEGLARAIASNPVSACQALAMGCIPVAVWQRDADNAMAFARLLVEISEREQLAYWQIWGASMLHAASLQFGSDTTAGDFDPDSLDALQADHLAMLDERTVSQLALDRVASGLVGWTAPEILRQRAATAGWYDPVEARSLLAEARAVAEGQGAVAWLKRIDATEAALPDRSHIHLAS